MTQLDTHDPKLMQIPRTRKFHESERSVYSLFVPKNMSLSTNASEKESSHGKEVLEGVKKHVKDALDILNRETSRTHKEMDAHVATKLEHVHFSEMVKLNVGGHLFSTSLPTLNKDPGDFE